MNFTGKNYFSVFIQLKEKREAKTGLKYLGLLLRKTMDFY
jgi:hypothetical protein